VIGTAAPSNRTAVRRVLAAAAVVAAGMPAAASVPSPLPERPPEVASQVQEARAVLRPGRQYRAEVPAPAAVLGYEIGDWHTDHARAQAYLNALAAAAPERTRLVDYAKSHEGRVLSYLVIGSEDSIAHLPARRAALAILADPRGKSDGDLAAAKRDARPVVWLGGTVHGDEHSPTEALLALAYHLVACDDDDVRALRDRILVVVDPIQNPDGRDRWVHWQTIAARPRAIADEAGIEHNEPWPGGRYNHDLFDMNRDMTILSQPETLGRARELASWSPQVVGDLHEFSGDSTYFFPPMNDPYNANIPESQRQLYVEFGKGNAEAFDAQGYDYYVRDTFDFFYVGYGDILPALMGSVGSTFEEASVGGLVYRKEDGSLATLTQAAAHHFTASLATCQTAARLGPDLLGSWLDYRKSAIEEGRTGPVRMYLIDPRVGGGAVRRTVGTLSLLGVEMKRLKKTTRIRARGFVSGEESEKEFMAGTIVIPLDQPLKRLIVALMERSAAVDEPFVLEERRRRAAGQSTRFYDLTGWSLPLAMGLEAAWSGSAPPADLDPVCAAPLGNAPAPGALLSCLRQSPAPSGPGAAARYGWLIRYDSTDSAIALASLAQAGVRVRVAGEPFTRGGLTWPRGTLLVRAKENEARTDLRERLGALAATLDLDIVPLDSSWTDAGASLGSDATVIVPAPRVALLFGPPTYPTGTGAALFVLDRRAGLAVTPVPKEELNAATLKRFDVLVLPDLGDADELPMETIQNWVAGGGTLVAIGDAAKAIADPKANFVKSRFVTDLRTLSVDLTEEGPASATATGAVSSQPAESPKKTPAKPAPEKPAAAAAEASKPASESPEGGGGETAEVPKDARPESTPGAIFRVALEPRSFLNFGYSRAESEVLVFSDHVLKAGEDATVTARYTASPLVSGFAWQKMQRALAGRAYAVHESVGSGRVILFAEDPVFRAGWEALDRMFLNAVLIGPAGLE